MNDVTEQMDDAVKLLFDENGKFRLPPDLTLSKAHLLSACISRELMRRNVKRAMEAAEAGGPVGGGMTG